MYAVSFIFKSSSLSLAFTFKSFKNADDCFKKGKMKEGIIDLEDDFKGRGTIDMSDVSGVSFTDIEEDSKKNCDIQIIQAKATMRAQVLAKNDVGLQMLSRSTGLAGLPDTTQ